MKKVARAEIQLYWPLKNVERIEVLINQQTIELNIGTFHSICALLLRKYGNAIGIERSFTISEDIKVQTAELKNGLLNIDLKRIIPEEKKSRLIKIN